MGLQVLSALDKARTQWYHFKAIIVSGMGFFTAAYNLFCIWPISNFIGSLYYKGDLPLHVNSILVGVALIGTIAGHLFFGWLGDRMGRKKVYALTLLLMVSSSFASGFSIGSSRDGVITSLCFFRFCLGVGVGGDHPLSATLMAEFSNIKTRGAFMASVYAMQGVGILAASTICQIVSACFSAWYPNPTFNQKDMVWRIILMLGAVPAGFTFYWRMKVRETPRYTALVARNAKQAAEDIAGVLTMNTADEEADVAEIDTWPKFALFSKDFAKLHGLKLLGTAAGCFFIDIVFYTNYMLQKDIYKHGGWLSGEYKNSLDELFYVARAEAFGALVANLPGYVFTVFLIDRIGRRKIQFGGFLLMSACIFVLGALYDRYWYKHEHRKGFLAIYLLAVFFSNFGPCTTTFIVPAELFPARWRSTCHGIASAAGKVGAIIGVFGFYNAAQPRGKDSPRRHTGDPTGIGSQNTLLLMGVASFLGCLCVFLIPETKGMSLEENEVELGVSDSTESASDSSEDSGSTSSEDNVA